MGEVIDGKFPQRPPRSPFNHLAYNLRQVVENVEAGLITSLEAVFIQDGQVFSLHGANPELALKLAKVMYEANLQQIPAVVSVEEHKP